MIAPTRTPPEVAGTITAADAARAAWQAVVVGAGPAGAATAWRLAARGVRTLVVDRHAFPRPKVCGCCLSARALGELAALGPGALPEAAVPLTAVRIVHRGSGSRMPLPEARVVSRELLDAHLLAHAIAAGCDWLPGVHVAALDDRAAEAAAPVRLSCTHDSAAGGSALSIDAGLVVVATGLADHLRLAEAHADERFIAAGSRIGAGGQLPATACDLPAGELVMAVGRDGYCGVVRLDDGRIDVAAALDRAAVARDATIGRAVARLLDEAAGAASFPLPDPRAVEAAAFRGTPPLTRRAAVVATASRRVFRVGDAAGYVEPFTGEGIGWALASGRVLAESLLAPRGLRPAAAAADLYRVAHHRAFAPLHARCRFVAAGLRRQHVVAAAVAAARALPWVAARAVPAVIGGRGTGGDR